MIFVALAVAWAVYLIPKALKHHDEVVRGRSVEKFSHTMRVLARREPVSRSNARLVVAPTRAALRPPVETKARMTQALPESVAMRPRSPQAARAAARLAARRRRNVLAVILLAATAVTVLAAASVVGWAWTAVPAVVLIAWLVACRVSVKAERRVRPASEVSVPAAPEAHVEVGDEVDDVTGEIASVRVEPVTSAAAEAPAVLTGEIPIITESLAGGWDMVPTTLPTYVTKSSAPQRRTVATIDLDSTGVWSSGHNDEDSALARSAEQASRAARDDDEVRRVSGA